jgi:hypothetical protein
MGALLVCFRSEDDDPRPSLKATVPSISVPFDPPFLRSSVPPFLLNVLDLPSRCQAVQKTQQSGTTHHVRTRPCPWWWTHVVRDEIGRTTHPDQRAIPECGRRRRPAIGQGGPSLRAVRHHGPRAFFRGGRSAVDLPRSPRAPPNHRVPPDETPSARRGDTGCCSTEAQLPTTKNRWPNR